jgi:hypothetical protein
MKNIRLTRVIFVAAFVFASSALVGSGAFRGTARACVSCYNESVTAYQYCHANPTGVYEGCNFTHVCSQYDSANSIYRQECLLYSHSSRH